MSVEITDAYLRSQSKNKHFLFLQLFEYYCFNPTAKITEN